MWFEEVNTGLIEELKKCIKIKNAKGDLVPLQDNSFVVRKPEEDLKFEVFPCISIYNTSSKFDPLRYVTEPKTVSVNETEKTITLEDNAVPYDLTYQIDFWARYQTDIDQMTRTWLMKHHRQFNLSVVDDGGKERSCNALIQGGITKSDLVLNKERLFHSIIIYHIWVEIDDETRYNKPMVIDRSLGVTPKGKGG